MTIPLTVNGTAREVPPGLALLAALRHLGIEVPQACSDDRFKSSTACRLCLVRVNGGERPLPACATAAEAGMVVETHPPDIERERRVILAMLARHLPPEEVAAHPERPFYRLLAHYGVAAGTAQPAGGPIRLPVDDAHPCIRVDLSQCILCLRCVHVCEAAQGRGVWHIQGHGETLRVVPDSGGPLLGSSCTSCGACAEACPTGAITDHEVLEHGAPTDWTRTACPYCGVGCEMEVGVRAGRIVQVLPAHDAPVNKGHLCVKGRYAHGFVTAADRVVSPMVRDKLAGGGYGGGYSPWRQVSWDEAIARAADGLRAALAKGGPAAVGVLGSARATNEENFLAQKFARLVLGTNNVDCCARVCHGPTAAAMKAMLGTGAATNSFDDIEQAASFMVCGSNATENHPIVGKRILHAVLRGAPLVVVDPRRTELAAAATVHLAPKPGTNVPLFNAMACAILEEGLADPAALRDRVDGAEEFRRFVADFAPEKVADLCGVEAQALRRAARLYATAKPAMCFHGLGLTEQVQGTEGVMALVNLALLTGNFGRPGSGVNPLRGQNNVQGSAHMGCEPSSLTGGVPLEKGRAAVEAAWGAPLPKVQGLNLMQMVDAAASGRFHALWAMGYDVGLTNPQAETTIAALQRLDCLVVQDLFMTETARLAGTVFLPAASSFEKDGTFMNSERRIQRVRKVLEPPGDSKSDQEIIALLAQAMGCGAQFAHRDAEAVWEEIRQVWKAGAGISYARIAKAGLQWPCPTEDHPGTAVLHRETFPVGPRATLRRIPHRPSAENPDADFPLLLVTGRGLHHFNAGTMTMRSRHASLHPTDTLDMAPTDAAALGLADGQPVRLASRYGEAQLPLRITDQVKPGEVFATFQDAGVFLNRVTGPGRDGTTMTPEYKRTAVRVRPA